MIFYLYSNGDKRVDGDEAARQSLARLGGMGWAIFAQNVLSYPLTIVGEHRALRARRASPALSRFAHPAVEREKG